MLFAIVTITILLGGAFTFYGLEYDIIPNEKSLSGGVMHLDRPASPSEAAEAFMWAFLMSDTARVRYLSEGEAEEQALQYINRYRTRMGLDLAAITNAVVRHGMRFTVDNVKVMGPSVIVDFTLSIPNQENFSSWLQVQPGLAEEAADIYMGGMQHLVPQFTASGTAEQKISQVFEALDDLDFTIVELHQIVQKRMSELMEEQVERYVDEMGEDAFREREDSKGKLTLERIDDRWVVTKMN